MASVDVAFVGTVVSSRARFVWDIEIETVAKDPDLGPVVTVLGADAGGGCGPDYGRVGNRVAVLGTSDGTRVKGRACSFLSPDQLESMRAQPPPSGRGKVAAVASMPYRWANVVALNSGGEVLASTWLDVEGAAAPCSGTNEMLFLASESSADPVAVVVDIATLEPTGERIPLGGAIPYTASLSCRSVAGDRTAIVTSVGEDGDGFARVVGAGGQTEVALDDSHAQVLDRTGRVIVTPARRGEPLRLLAARTLEVVGSLDLEGIAVIDAAIHADGTTVALLIADTERVEYETEASGISIVDVSGDQPVVVGGFPFADGPGNATWVSWFGDDLVIDRDLSNSRLVEIRDRDGRLLGDQEVDWGFHVVDIGGMAVRATNSGLAEITRSAGTRPLLGESRWSQGSVSRIVDGPVAEPVQPEEFLLKPYDLDAHTPTTKTGTPPARDVAEGRAGTNSDGSDSPSAGLIVAIVAVAIAIASALVAVRFRRKADNVDA